MFKSHSSIQLNLALLFYICALLTLSNNLLSQPFDILLEKILLQDESINSSKTLIKKNKNDLSSAWSAYTPKLDLTIPLGKESLINSDSDNTNMDYYELDAKISQNIYDFGATSSKIEVAKNQLELSKISSDNIKSSKIFEALSAYLNYIKMKNILTYALESENRIKKVTNLENEKVARGAGLASNVLQSKAKLAGARSTRVRFEGDLAIAENRFFNVFREIPKDFSTFKVPDLPVQLLPDSQEDAITTAKNNNIALKISDLNLKNSKTKVKGSKAKFLPSLKAVAQYKNKRNVSGISGTEIDQTYKLEMNYPISIGGPFGLFYKENADYKSTMNQYMIAKYNHDKLERNLEESVRNSWQTKKIAKENYEYLDNQANISGEFFALAMKEVKLGNRQLIDILSSETAFINAKSSAENARTDYQLAVYQLLFSIGILDENIFKKTTSQRKNKKLAISDTKENPNIRIPKDYKSQILNKRNEAPNINSNQIKKSVVNDMKSNQPKNILNKKTKEVFSEKKTNPKLLKVTNSLTLTKEKKEVTNSYKKEESNTNNLLKDNDIKIVSSSSETKTNEKKHLINKKKSKEYKIQLGAFGRLENANKFLKKIRNKNNNILQLFIEEDMKSGLFKVKSSSSFNKTQSTKICNDLKKMYVDCILSQI